MRLSILLLFIFQLKPDFTWGQSSRSVNLIITIDDNVATNLDGFKLILQTDKEADTINAEYLPGRLQFKKDIDVQKIINDSNQVILVFFYNDYGKATIKQHSYRITMSNEAVQRDFNIIHIFNLDDKFNRNRFVDIQQKEYVYDYIYPGGGRLAARR